MSSPTKSLSQKRLLSLDVLRGIIMILLAAESCMLYESMELALPGNPVVQQFFHHPWHGLRFWDLVQPAFMTMAGAALYISFFYKEQKGISWRKNFPHVAIRCLKLFLLGTALHCVYSGKMVWELWNVLTQLSVTTLIAYAIIRWKSSSQIIVSVLLLILTEILYRFVQTPAFNEPFISGKNFGNLADIFLMGKLNTDGWVAINIIPTAAHTIWGAVAGKLLISNNSGIFKIKKLIVTAIICLAIGYALDLSGTTPIIKRIATSSFTLVSGGYVLLMMAFLYWLTDVRAINRYAWIFVVVGMNAIFIYLFFETVGHQWLNGTIAIFVTGAASLFHVPQKVIAVISALVTLVAEWGICYWLFKRKIFFKL